MTAIAVGNRRLLKLAAFLEKLPRKRFDYASFVGDEWKGAPDLSCGTTACAMGWATTMPLFRRLGLRMNRNGYPVNGGGDVSGVHAGNEIFALDMFDARRLFLPSYSIDSPRDTATAKQVAAHIRKFVRERSAK